MIELESSIGYLGDLLLEFYAMIPDNYVHILKLYLKHKTYQDIADIIGMYKGTVYKIVNRMIIFLRYYIPYQQLLRRRINFWDDVCGELGEEKYKVIKSILEPKPLRIRAQSIIGSRTYPSEVIYSAAVQFCLESLESRSYTSCDYKILLEYIKAHRKFYYQIGRYKNG